MTLQRRTHQLSRNLLHPFPRLLHLNSVWTLWLTCLGRKQFIYSNISNHHVLILVDDGRTRNFVQTHIAKFLSLPSALTLAMQVMVGNGTTFECDTSCPQVSIIIQGHCFVIHFYAHHWRKRRTCSWRCCMDYHALNLVIVKDMFPMPTIDELGQASWFSKLDLYQGFHQIRVAEEDIPKTTFCMHHGHYEFRVMLFKLCNAPSTFLATMNELLKPFLCKFETVFFDDILIYNLTLPFHLDHLEAMLTSLSKGEFYLHRSKCLFAKHKLQYMGHIVSA